MARSGRWVLAAAVLATVAAAPPATGGDLVDVQALSPDIRLDMRYATADNFTHHKIYPVAKCYLRRPVAERLARVQAALARDGLGLKVFDCYRPLSVQREFWRLVPDERYVADPAKGSRHNRGAAVDLTLVTRAGEELTMPTSFDDFSERAHRDFRRLPRDRIRHREQLEQAMRREGFIPFPTEWWHFDDPDWQRYPMLDLPLDRTL
jgi:D-alanyl-D-alanine dipeptidase